jgi:hypothetical protein
MSSGNSRSNEIFYIAATVWNKKGGKWFLLYYLDENIFSCCLSIDGVLSAGFLHQTLIYGSFYDI